MKSKTVFLQYFLALLIFQPFSAWSQVKFPAIIGDNMVIQQNFKVPLWGWTTPGKIVSVVPSWNKKKISARSGPDGKWMVIVETPAAGGPHSIKVNDTVLNNILIGEVWLCSGQSNMEWPVRSSNNAAEEIKNAEHPQIRIFTVARMFSDEPLQNCYGQWLECNPSTVENFSAVAYYFGKELNKTLNVPVGLINSSWGGTPAEAWTRNGVLKSLKDLEVYLNRFEDKARKSKPGISPFNQTAPSALYNAMIAPLIPYSIKGVIWYQGEANVNEPGLYEVLFPAMINNWRRDWGERDFPFYYVQIAPFDYEVPLSGALLRDAQRKVLSVPNTGMVVTLDIGDSLDIHPTNKQEVGQRLALLALANNYEKRDRLYSIPLYTSMNIEQNKIRLDFSGTTQGLVAKDGVLKNFEIAGKDEIFVPAQAEIDGTTLLVSAPEIKSPLAVRYAFKNTSEASLFNSSNQPASSFRTDNWYINVEKTEIKCRFDTTDKEFVISMATLLNPMEIHFDNEGNEPNRHSDLYKEPVHSKKSGVIIARAFKNDVGSTSISSLHLDYHLAVGIKPVLQNSYNKKYNGGGPGALTDGISGSTSYDDGYWQGYYSRDLDAVIDLGKEKKIRQVSTGFLQSVNDWIFFPRKIEVWVSENGVDFTSAGEIIVEESLLQTPKARKNFDLVFKGIKTRYIKVRATALKICPEGHPGEGEKAWLFSDEIIVE